MAARAIWKGVVKVGKIRLPVKLYSAIHDHTVHFRLLHRTDHAPVKQRMIDPESGEEVPYRKTHKAWPAGRNRLVMLDEEELKAVEPEPSRDIEITRFVAADSIDHRWYERAYYLGPDKSKDSYFAAVEGMRKKKRAGVARWVMRKKQYVGALREHEGYLVLIALRYADEIIDADALPRPQGRALEKREIAMGEQLVEALSGPFDPADFKDEYHDRVLELIEAKARGRKPKVKAFRPRKTKEDKLAAMLEASLDQKGKKRVA